MQVWIKKNYFKYTFRKTCKIQMSIVMLITNQANKAVSDVNSVQGCWAVFRNGSINLSMCLLHSEHGISYCTQSIALVTALRAGHRLLHSEHGISYCTQSMASVTALRAWHWLLHSEHGISYCTQSMSLVTALRAWHQLLHTENDFDYLHATLLRNILHTAELLHRSTVLLCYTPQPWVAE